MLACFHSDGILPQLSDFLKMIRRIGEINSLHSFSILLGILSGPAALCGFRLFSNLFMPVSVMSVWALSFIRNRIGIIWRERFFKSIDCLIFQLYF